MCLAFKTNSTYIVGIKVVHVYYASHRKDVEHELIAVNQITNINQALLNKNDSINLLIYVQYDLARLKRFPL